MLIQITQADGSYTIAKRADRPSLLELQKMVGGYIEFVVLPDNCGKLMIANEEGLLLSLPINMAASAEMKAAWLEVADESELSAEMMVLVGPVVTITGTPDELEGF